MESKNTKNRTDGRKTPITYIIDEKHLSQKLETKIEFPLRLFNLRGLGVNQEKFLKDLAPSFAKLPWDYYDVRRERIEIIRRYYPENKKLEDFFSEYYAGKKGMEEIEWFIKNLPLKARKDFRQIRPYRRRSVARFVFERSDSGEWSFKRIRVRAFSQNVKSTDYRSQKRVFTETPAKTVNHPEFQKLLQNVADIVSSVRPGARKIVATMHQVRTFARPGHPGDNAPEGIHQDGADYIISAIEVRQISSWGGVSTIYGPNKKTRYLTVNLGAGEGIFQADKGSPFWHDVTPIYEDPKTPQHWGVRDILGFDIRIAKEENKN